MASDKAMELARELVNDLSYMLADSRVCRAKATELLASRLEPIVEAAQRAVRFETDFPDVFIELRARGWHYSEDAGRVHDGKELWAVTRHGACLAKDGEWEYEPIPSSRTEDFYARCRWNSYEEAENAAKTALHPSVPAPAREEK